MFPIMISPLGLICDLISGFQSMALLIWEMGAFAIVDLQTHGQYGVLICYVPAGQTSSTDIVTWLSNMV